jgi:hypothetical protein
MKPPLRNDGPVLDELIQRVRRLGDSQEIGSETKVTLPFSTNKRMKAEPKETDHHEGRSKAHPSAAAILEQETITPERQFSAFDMPRSTAKTSRN